MSNSPVVESQQARSRVRSVVRWVPASLLGVSMVLCWTFLFLGGFGAVVAWVVLITVGQVLGPLTVLVVVVHTIRKRRFSRPMAVALALALFSLWPALWGFGLFTMTFPASRDRTSPSATVRLPSDHALRVVWGGDRLETNQHAATPDQRWAYDFVIEPAMHSSSRLEDYGCYGTPVLAPVAALVHHAVDGEPDETPGVSTNVMVPFGNHVVLKLETGTYLILAHLKRGSVVVRAGDQVSEGQPIGLSGNSGNTSEPHIHIHHQRQDPTRFPVNFAEGLPLYFRDHDGPAMPEGGVDVRDGKPMLVGAIVQHRGVP